MAIGGAFLGGGVELVPAGSCKLELEAYTDNATISATFTITGGGNTYSVTSGTDGRASKVVPSGVTYTVSATVTGYTAPPSQTVIAESSSIKYVRFDAQLKKAQGDISTLQADVDKAEGDISTLKTDVGNAQGDISTLQADVRRAQSTADSKADTTVATQSANGLMSSADKTKLDGVDSALAGKVSKSGDTMTGNLSINMPSPILYLKTTTEGNYGDIIFSGADGNRTSLIRGVDGVESNSLIIALINPTNGSLNYALNIGYDSNNLLNVTAPSWSVGTNDNSDKILTIKMTNSLPSLVHTTGNETVSGSKVFTIPVTDPQNQSGRVTTPNSNANATPYYKIASISMNNVSAWDTVTLTFDVERGWNASEHHVCTFRAFFSTEGDRAINRALLSKIWSSGQAYSTVLNADHWWILHNATTKEVQIWMKSEYNQLTLNYRVRMSGRRNENFAKWKLHTSTGVASLPSTDDGWVIVNATDTSNRMTFSTPADATGQEIATADWALSKFQRKITYGTGDPPSDGQAGDIYIKI